RTHFQNANENGMPRSAPSLRADILAGSSSLPRLSCHNEVCGTHRRRRRTPAHAPPGTPVVSHAETHNEKRLRLPCCAWQKPAASFADQTDLHRLHTNRLAPPSPTGNFAAQKSRE